MRQRSDFFTDYGSVVPHCEASPFWNLRNRADKIPKGTGTISRDASEGLTMSAEQWEVLKKELRDDADREMAATTDQTRKDSIRADLTSFVRLPVPTSDYEMDQRRSLASEYRTRWSNAGKDSRMRDALFGRMNRTEPKDG
jgi:hypothetical protein